LKWGSKSKSDQSRSVLLIRHCEIQIETKRSELRHYWDVLGFELGRRFGIGMNKDHTLEEVGQQFSLTRERIRQIEAKALRKLKHPGRSRTLRSFLDN
jgi:hypothetical protein